MRAAPVGVSASALLLVALGGAVGSAGRAAIALALPASPLAATLLVNVAGACALGALVGVLDGTAPAGGEGYRRRRDRHRRVHLLLGTGFCGGFTTYSAVALHVAELVGDSAVLHAVGYSLVTLVAGMLATVAGLALVGSARAGRRG